MIKFRKARFSNFRGLRDVSVEFSTDDSRPLTVIRAENFTGKTTMLYALTWALFGDAGLPEPPKRRSEYRLHPVDWDVIDDGQDVVIQVDVEFTVVDDKSGVKTNYLLQRVGSERLVGDNWQANSTDYRLFKQTPEGDEPVRNPDLIMDRDLLPLAKKDIFFVDGDARVRDYVTDDESASRVNVKNAVRHLLSLDVVEAAYSHVDGVASEKLKKVKSQSAGTDLARILEDLEEVRANLAAARQELEDATGELRAAQKRKAEANKARDAALSAGGADAAAVRKQLDGAKSRRSTAIGQKAQMAGRMQTLLNSHRLLDEVAGSAVAHADRVYDQLRRDKKIPNVLPGLLKDRLAEGTCICGADLGPGTAARTTMEDELQVVSRHDSILNSLADLAEHARAVLREATWAASADTALTGWFAAEASVDQESNEIANLNHKIERLSKADEDLQVANANLARANESEEHYRNAVRAKEDVVKRLQAKESDLDAQRTVLQGKEKKFNEFAAQEQVAQDVKDILKHAVDVLLGETIDEVSVRMNELFMNMIASSPEAAANVGIVKRVALSRDCTIRVFGPEDRELKPRTDISGAQQQALTVALIMALIEVSGETSPMLIDTPLGMTSGAVRTKFLTETLGLAHSRSEDEQSEHNVVPQKILFMTGQEILGVEDILEAAAGKTWTLTNAQHYPDKLKNDPKTRFSEVLVCECGPRKTSNCDLCALREDY